MKYYDMHEDVYKDLNAKGKVSWDGESEVSEILNHEINQSIDKYLSKYYPHCQDMVAVDLGTGTGTCALYLSKQGFEVTGYDLSETAISMAIQNNLKLGLNAKFFVKDITTLEISKSIDLITDSSLLHCLVLDQDRKNFFLNARKMLSNDGHLFIHTMIESKDMSEITNRNYLLLKDTVLWSEGKDSWEMDWQYIEGRKVFPHRRILTETLLEEEIIENGFDILEKEIMSNGKNPDTYTGLLKKKD